MKNTLKDNPYLGNIIKSINTNLKWIEERPDADPIGMLVYVANHCAKRISEMQEKKDKKTRG
jgi:hypothetical protein